MARKKCYVVKKSRIRGVYDSWAECQKNINGYSGAVYKSFNTKEEAEEYLKWNEQDDKTNTNFDGSKNCAIAYIEVKSLMNCKKLFNYLQKEYNKEGLSV